MEGDDSVGEEGKTDCMGDVTAGYVAGTSLVVKLTGGRGKT